MKKQVNRRNVIWALIFAVIFPISVFILSKYLFSLPIILLIIGINAIVFGIYTFTLIRSIKMMDEVQIRIQLEAVIIAFLMSLLLVMTLGMAQIAKALGFEGISFLYIFPLFFLFYIVGLIFSNSKYK